MMVLIVLKHAIKVPSYSAIAIKQYTMKLAKYLTYVTSANIDFFLGIEMVEPILIRLVLCSYKYGYIFKIRPSQLITYKIFRNNTVQ